VFISNSNLKDYNPKVFVVVHSGKHLAKEQSFVTAGLVDFLFLFSNLFFKPLDNLKQKN
jgi:hypothetical protein